MQIRAAVPGDADAVVALRSVVYPYLVRGVESTRAMLADPPAGQHWTAFAVRSGGQLVGWVSAFLAQTPGPATGEIPLLHVHPGHRGRGIGTALFEAAAGHLRSAGAVRARVWSQPESLGFARRHGFEPAGSVVYSALDPRLAPAVPTVPDGIRLAPLSSLDPRTAHAAHVAAAADEPGDVPQAELSFETWRYEVWDSAGLDTGASSVAMLGSGVAAFSLVKRDGDRMWSDMTATVPAERGRGLGLLV
jgi:GNAT superfamily N-acetyltransferase